MLLSVLPVPFVAAAQQRQYEAVLAALRAAAPAPATVLLGNLAAFTPLAADALVVWPGGWALLGLLPHAGHLTVPPLADGAWQLDGRPLPGYLGGANPLAQYCTQQPAARAWLSEQLGRLPAQLPLGAGLALFEAPLTFGPEVEAYLNHYAAAHDFELVAAAGQLPLRLRQLATAAGAPQLPAPELLAWASQLATGLAPAEASWAEDLAEEDSGEEDLPEEGLAEPSAADYLGHKLRQLWRWLGAEDIPADPPYGAAPLPAAPAPDPLAAARLQQLRQELQHELAQQRHEAASREATLLQELAQLRQQVAHSSQPAARLAEQQENARFEAAVQTTRAELAARTQELDARIRQLSHLMGQLQRPVASPVAPAAAPGPPRATRPALAPKPAYRRLYQVERWGLVGLALAIVGAGGWSIARLVHPLKSRPLTTVPRRAPASYDAAEASPAPPVIIYDTLASPRPSRDTATAATEAAEIAPATEAPPTVVSPALTRPDSAGPARAPAPTEAPADSAAASPSPAP